MPQYIHTLSLRIGRRKWPGAAPDDSPAASHPHAGAGGRPPRRVDRVRGVDGDGGDLGDGARRGPVGQAQLVVSRRAAALAGGTGGAAAVLAVRPHLVGPAGLVGRGAERRGLSVALRRAVEEALEEGLEAGQAGGGDARVALGRDPDGQVGRVPEEVARLAVVGQEEGLDDGGRDGAGIQSSQIW